MALCDLVCLGRGLCQLLQQRWPVVGQPARHHPGPSLVHRVRVRRVGRQPFGADATLALQILTKPPAPVHRPAVSGHNDRALQVAPEVVQEGDHRILCDVRPRIEVQAQARLLPPWQNRQRSDGRGPCPNGTGGAAAPGSGHAGPTCAAPWAVSESSFRPERPDEPSDGRLLFDPGPVTPYPSGHDLLVPLQCLLLGPLTGKAQGAQEPGEGIDVIAGSVSGGGGG